MSSTGTCANQAPARTRPEILAPAGDWECARAAVENGADAIYFGLERFNARMRAHNFTLEDLPELMSWLHSRGVRGYVTFNVLVFADEIDKAVDYLRRIIAAGVDAAIVQDVGVCRLIRSLSPDFPIHASTQMTVTSAAGVEFARALGCELVVLARECSIAEIEKIQERQRATHLKPLPLETFVHGALCVAYSGQCLTSESLGGRSANRGECAQACRMPYELISDGRKIDLGDRRYLLSPQDLAGLEVVPELVRAGVSSFKIEGRLKAPEYVAAITRIYRQAVDRALAGDVQERVPAADRYTMEMSFSRGLYTGWFRGIDNQKLAHGRFGTKRGVFLGEVLSILPREQSVLARLEADLKPGDGIVFDAGKHDQGEEGGRVFTLRRERDGSHRLTFGREALDYSRIHPGDRIWKTSDPELARNIRATYEGGQPRFQRPVDAEVHGIAGKPLTLNLVDDEGNQGRAESTIPLALADKTPLNTATLAAQIGRLGGTPFKLRSLTSHLPENVILPVSQLNQIRREAVDRLLAARRSPRRWTLNPTPKLEPVKDVTPSHPVPASPELIAVIRLPHQLDAAWAAGCRTVYCEFENPKRYRDAVTRFRELQASVSPGGNRGEILVAPPRIFKHGEEWILEQVKSCQADGWLLRNPDHLAFFREGRRRGDFPLNVANGLAAEHFIRDHGLERVTASYDLNVEQLQALLRSAPAHWFEITLHQHMPMFHMEHCVFCAFMSSGKDYRDCGRPCEKHVVGLRDRVGQTHLLRADAGCRNTVYNARAQTGAEFAQLFIDAGARYFRVEFLDETVDVVTATLRRYQDLLAGRISGTDLWREFKLVNQLGVTRGQLEGFGAATGNARQA
jgi:putative protease